MNGFLLPSCLHTPDRYYPLSFTPGTSSLSTLCTSPTCAFKDLTNYQLESLLNILSNFNPSISILIFSHINFAFPLSPPQDPHTPNCKTAMSSKTLQILYIPLNMPNYSSPLPFSLFIYNESHHILAPFMHSSIYLITFHSGYSHAQSCIPILVLLCFFLSVSRDNTNKGIQTLQAHPFQSSPTTHHVYRDMHYMLHISTGYLYSEPPLPICKTSRLSSTGKLTKMHTCTTRCTATYLLEAYVGRILSEALSADHKAVLPDEAMTVGARPAEKEMQRTFMTNHNTKPKEQQKSISFTNDAQRGS